MKGIRFRKIAAILLAALVLCALPVAAFAESNISISAVQPYALGTGHNISVKIYKVVLDSSKPLGYQTPELVTTITVTCTDGTGHSGYNPFVKLKEFYPTNVGTGLAGNSMAITAAVKETKRFTVGQVVL